MPARLIWPLAAVAAGLVAYFAIRTPAFTPPETFPTPSTSKGEPDAKAPKVGVATFASGCFWCTEALFQRLKGVTKVESGYSGGTVKDPTYEQVCSGSTGHAECIQVTFDPKVVSYPELLEIFWRSHDPTTLNRQGADVGTQYRSAVFFHSERQKEEALHYKRQIDLAHVYDKPIVTEIVPFTAFYPAEKYHQDFFNQNPNQGYCRAVIGPKLEKLKHVFADKLKP